MSVVSSRISSVSTLLKGSGVRSQLIKQSNRVYFKLPNDIKKILCDFETGNGIKEYKNLIHLLREGVIKDSDLTEFLEEARECVSSLGIQHELFIQAILQLEWTNRSSEVTSTYKHFLQDLVCMQLCHLKAVINHLVQLFKPVKDNNAEHEVEEMKPEDIERLNHIHDILHKILELIPMSSKLLLQSLGSQFPYIKQSTYTHKIYISALLHILNYAPQFRPDILSLIINRLTVLDIDIPRKKITDDDDEEEDDNIHNNKTTDDVTKLDIDADKTIIDHPSARTLDTCMELFLKYMNEFCFANDVLKIESLRILYTDILRLFETVILSTHVSLYVQYIMFYICSFKPVVAETFTDWLWCKVIDLNAAPVLRQTAVYYISSLLTTASYISHELVRHTMSTLTKWLHNYIAMQEHSECMMMTDDDAKAHIVFYSVCQAFFYLFNARYKEFVTSNNGIIFLQELNISSIVACQLNPLQICTTEIVYKFANITSTYQLAYCYTIIEINERSELPIFGRKRRLLVLLPRFFPFGSCLLRHSRQRLSPLFRNNIMDAESDK